MDALFDYRIPVLHPLAVHFPVALLLAAAVAALIWMFAGTTFWRRASLFLMLMGTAGAFFAYFTGERMEEQAEGVPIVDQLVGLHQSMGLYTLVASCIATAVLTAGSLAMERRHEERDPLLFRVAAACLVFIAAALVAWTAHVGATMVWGV